MMTDQDVAALEDMMERIWVMLREQAQDGGPIETSHGRKVRGEISSRAKWLMNAIKKAIPEADLR